MKKIEAVALTGNIATGKSYVANILEKQYGFFLIDADKIGHEVLRFPEIIEKIVEVFGSKVFSNNQIDRKTLGTVVFKDSEKLEQLNAIVHPKLKEISLQRIDKGINEGRNVIFEAAILFEVGWNDLFDTTIVTVCHPQIQVERIIERNNFSKEKANNIINSQMAQAEKIRKSTYVIDTSFGPDAYIKNLELIAKDIHEKHKRS